ncbi:MAG TPA: hypothetical protein QF480_08790 [Bacteroidales bacterium]|jgi:hypothetical protein|nr:hypothetical protein [Bacteroidales bacterium]|tara:strand:- start:264 stop:668 length:405 start_codon:yes stop_codon:yes gene_type:complete
MKQLFKPPVLILTLAIIITSCGGSPEKELIGTWKAQKVETDFDEQFTTPEMLRQVVEMQKETYFRIIDDSTLIIISPGNTHETKWSLDPDDQSISYFFDSSPNQLNKLGTFSSDKIVSETNTPIGKITIYYEKE